MTDNQKNLFTIQDVIDEQDKQIMVDTSKVYDPKHFWDDYAELYFKGMRTIVDVQKHAAWLTQRLKTFNIDHLLDVGCGFCRLEPFLIDSEAVKRITAVDISDKMLKIATDTYLKGKVGEELKPYPHMDKITIQNASVKALPFERDSFDCIMACELFSHLPFHKVNIGLRSMRQVTKEYVVLVERYVFPEEHPYPHVWSHDYVKLAGDCGFVVLEAKMIGNGAIGLVLRKGGRVKRDEQK